MMIQRIQTLYLLIIAALMAVTLFSGLACIVLVLDLPFWVSVVCCAAAAVPAALGLCGCGGIAAKAARAAVTVLFALALASALVLGCIIAAIGI